MHIASAEPIPYYIASLPFFVNAFPAFDDSRMFWIIALACAAFEQTCSAAARITRNCRKPAACPVGLPCRSFADWDCRNGEKGFRPSVSPLDRQLGGSPRWECSVALWLAPLGMSSRTETAHKARSADNRVETSTKLS